MSLASNELQRAIYTRLHTQLATPIYDYVPQKSAYPYVVIADLTAIPWDMKGGDGQEFTITIHAFDKAAGKKSVQDIAENIYAALHQREDSLPMTGYTASLIRCEFNEAFQDPAAEGDVDRYFHAVQRYRVLVQDN